MLELNRYLLLLIDRYLRYLSYLDLIIIKAPSTTAIVYDLTLAIVFKTLLTDLNSNKQDTDTYLNGLENTLVIVYTTL